MNTTFLIRLLRLALLLAIQVVALNNIHILGYATPLFVGYQVTALHQGTSRMAALMWGFVTGLAFDIFSNTAGMASAALTLAAMVQPKLLSIFTPRDAPESMVPGFKTIAFFGYIAYSFLLMLIVHAVFYSLDAFSLNDWPLTIKSIAVSTILATLLAIAAEMTTRPRPTA